MSIINCGVFNRPDNTTQAHIDNDTSTIEKPDTHNACIIYFITDTLLVSVEVLRISKPLLGNHADTLLQTVSYYSYPIVVCGLLRIVEYRK
jgi:hypothetical protein